MQYRVLACDYDGTLATHGLVDAATVGSLRRLLDSGRELVMVTGRELPELQAIFPELGLFRYVVAENGGLLFTPETGDARALADPPPAAFVAELSARGVGPISVGRSIVATWEPHEAVVLATIRDLGLDLQVIFNKGAVMILPSGVNKATGLTAALAELKISRQNTIAIGDAENDHAFLQHCRVGAAVANALAALKERAELVMKADHGAGVAELIDHVLENDLQDLNAKLTRHQWRVSQPDGSGEIAWQPGLQHLLVHGCGGETDHALLQIASFLARGGFQFCLVRQGEPLAPAHHSHSPLVTVGSGAALPHADEVLHNLDRPDENVQVLVAAGSKKDQADCVVTLCERLRRWRNESDRPHVLLLPCVEALKDIGVSPHELASGFPSVVMTGEHARPGDLFPAATVAVTCDAESWLTPTSKACHG